MKNSFIAVIALFAAVISISSCGNKGEDIEVPKGMQLADLSKYGKPFTMIVPDSNTAKGVLEISENNYMLEMRAGKSFGLVIEEGPGNMEQLKADIKDDEINKFKGWIAEEPTMLVWQSEITVPEYHLYAVVTVGNSKYVIKDLVSTDNEPYTEADIRQMLNSVKSIREKKMES